MEELILNLAKLHTTELGVGRIKRNLGLDTDDIVAWCKQKIKNHRCSVVRRDKNWYSCIGDCETTVDTHSYSIITAHKIYR